MMQQLRCLSAAALLCVLLGPVHAQAVDQSLAGVHKALTGRWEGLVQGVRPATGESFSQPDTFTFTPTGSDHLSAAWWTDFGLILYAYRGEGSFHAKTFGPNGPGFEEELQISVPQPIDEAGNGRWIVAGWATSPDGSQMEIREIFSISSSGLTMVTEQRPRSVPGATYKVIAEATYKRVARR